MSGFGKSYKTVHYELRPAKQVERRMLVDAFILLMETGFFVRDYIYVGMGCVHFIDFILFHKLLGIEKMTSVESLDEISRRVEFNAPYAGVRGGEAVVTVRTQERIGDYLAMMPNDKRHIVWLDYDSILSKDMLEDIYLASSRLLPGSILLITVDTETPKEIDFPERHNDSEISFEYYSDIAGEYMDAGMNTSSFSKREMPKRITEFVAKTIQSSLASRDDLQFLPLFNFLYQDGHRMLTLGGMIGNGKTRKRIKSSRLSKMPYIRLDFESDPCWIKVPTLTRKERLYLESRIPFPEGWAPKHFEMAPDDIEHYKNMYRFFPAFAELLL